MYIDVGHANPKFGQLESPFPPTSTPHQLGVNALGNFLKACVEDKEFMSLVC